MHSILTPIHSSSNRSAWHEAGARSASASTVRVRAERERKDPQKFANMDAARDYLHSQASSSWGIAQALNYLSENAFGREAKGVLATLYRRIASSPRSQPQSLPREPVRVAQARLGLTDDDLQALACVLSCSESQAVRIVGRRGPRLQDPAWLAARVVALKQALPRVDVAALLDRKPDVFLSDDEDLPARVGRRFKFLSQYLSGADVAAMVEEDPALLVDDVEAGVEEFHRLWPHLDADTLR